MYCVQQHGFRQMSPVLSDLKAAFPLDWQLRPSGSYRAACRPGYLEVIETNRMDSGVRGRIEFYICGSGNAKRQIFTLGWYHEKARCPQLRQARIMLEALQTATSAILLRQAPAEERSQ